MYFKKIIFRAELNLLIVIFLIVKNFSLQKEIYYLTNQFIRTFTNLNASMRDVRNLII